MRSPRSTADSGTTVRVVSLDIGGTVADVGPGSITARLAVALDREFGTVRAALQPFKTRRNPASLVAEQVCAATSSPGRIEAATAILAQARLDTAVMTPFEDVLPALCELRALGVRIVLFSNVMGCAAPPAGSAPPLDAAVDRTFYSCDIGYAKPDPRAFREVARRLDVGADHILHVGDALETDVRGARAAGWQALLIDRSAPQDGPTWIRSLRSLPARLRDEPGIGSAGQRGASHA
jgi:FMN phosphatase YigB (HAD superfamily)